VTRKPPIALAVALCALAVACLGSAPVAQAFRFDPRGPRVTATTVPYHTNLVSHLSEVRAAANAWNRSGARLRFVPSSRARALVTIGVNFNLGRGVAGLTISHGRTATVFINPNTIEDVADGANELRFLYTFTIAHELGHTIGLLHETRTCALMNPSNDRPRCAEPSDPDRFFRCRLLEPDDIAGAVALRGGRANAPLKPTFCPIG
jgi:hypothetical protein